MIDTAKRLKALSDATRLRILYMIAQTDECCVCEIQNVLELTAPTTSRNLRILEEAGFVNKRRDGKWMHYRLSELPARWEALRKTVFGVIEESGDAEDVLERFADWRGKSCCLASSDAEEMGK
ncbi:HTH-type transcriptional repressor AseR [bacterium BMS3Bbin04]|nr:HTH-type transcriptional repressor AseR [bacterium BMS3Bbin04]